MKITVFGASGQIGKLLVNQALEEGYHVVAYVRNPDKLMISHSNLTMIKGELSDLDTIRQAILGADAIISTLGPSMSPKATGFPVLEGHINIIKAMKLENISRFITLATPSVTSDKDQKSMATIIPGIMAKLFLPRAYKEIIEIGTSVKNSDLDYTIVRIIAPNDKPKTNTTKVSFGDKRIKFSLSRANIADFMLRQVTDTEYIRSMPIIGS